MASLKAIAAQNNKTLRQRSVCAGSDFLWFKALFGDAAKLECIADDKEDVLLRNYCFDKGYKKLKYKRKPKTNLSYKSIIGKERYK
ncbi:MAG TPA: hypothetical protein DCW90_08720 [Lachnospiraceae bacterium]|nr:hypothetical protein [Lachnospiraceae bacterium]